MRTALSTREPRVCLSLKARTPDDPMPTDSDGEDERRTRTPSGGDGSSRKAGVSTKGFSGGGSGRGTSRNGRSTGSVSAEVLLA